MGKVVEEILSGLDEKEAMKHIAWLTENTPKRIAGMRNNDEAARYVCDKMAEYGLETKLLEFETYNSIPQNSLLKVLKPETLVIKSLPCCHIASTLPEGITARLEFVGAGSEEDYRGKDVTGKIVLVEVSYSPATPEKARIAALKGAVGMICMNWGGDEDVICMRALKSVWGNPTEDNFRKIPQIAGVSITRKAGEYLVELCKNSEVEVCLTAQATRQWDNLLQPLGIIKGCKEPEKFLLVSGHIDAWEPGVTCNAAGNGVLLEIARVMAKHREQLDRSIYFIFWNGHEIAEAAGSTWYLDHDWDNLRDNCIGYINIDSPGMKDATRFEVRASRELAGFAYSITEKYCPGTIDFKYLTKIGDQSFFGLGVPAVVGRSSFSEEIVKNNHGATLGWWNHTIEDTLDKVDLGNLKKDLTINCAYIWEMVNCLVLPYDFTVTLEDIKQKLEGLDKESEGILPLQDLVEKVDSLIADVQKINEAGVSLAAEIDRDKLILLNRLLIKLSRILTSVFYTNTDKYHQDSYGLSILAQPIPLLHPVLQLRKMDSSSLEYKLLFASLIKNYNRISDALNDSLDYIEMSLKGVK